MTISMISHKQNVRTLSKPLQWLIFGSRSCKRSIASLKQTSQKFRSHFIVQCAHHLLTDIIVFRSQHKRTHTRTHS